MLILSPIPKQFLDESGVPYTDGTVSIYLHGDTEFAEVYADAEGTALIENPCILDSHGMWQGFVDPDKPMDYIVKDSEGNVITRFCNISLPTGDDIPGVKVISSDGSINVDETLENGERTFDITVNDDMFKPSCAKFSHEAVNGGGQVSFDSFELEGDPDRDIYLADGVITLAEGVYHISANFVIGNDECHNEYFGITVNFGDCSTAKVWDRSFVHEESVEFGLDIVADVDGYTVVPTIAELPDDMHCSVSRLYIHKVSGSGVGGSMASVEHDGTLVGDGTHNDPLGVKDWSEIRTTLENTTNELLDHETANDAHQDIRDELERKEDKDNKVTSWGSMPSNEKYPSEKLVKDTLDNLPPGTAVKGDAESEYRTGNVNLTPDDIGSYSKTESDSRYKTKQTPVADPSASGNGLEFIDSVSQDANGEITPHKKSVQDGTTAQKGVVKLSNAIDSTSVTEAATPKAVKDAYDELNNKIVARAVFLSQAEWAVQSQLQGDPAKVYYVENGTGEDAYTVYVWRESTSTYEEVDESSIDLDGYWHDGPTTTGDGNVVTNITLGNDGVPQVEKGMSAEPAFSVLPISKGGTGKDNAKGALNALTSQMQHYDTIPQDETLIVQKFGTSSDGNGALYTRTWLYAWNYIKGKISSVLGLSENGYTGNAATASAAASGSALETAINGKADKVQGATAGNLAALDASGNLTDSGKNAADFDKKRYSWDTHGMYKVFESRNTDVSNKWVKLAEVDASSVTGNNNAIQFTGYVYNYGQNKRSYTKFVKVPFSAVFNITDDSQGVVVGNISGIDPLFGGPRVNDLIRIEKIDSKHWILELYTYSYQAYSLEIEASTLISSSLSLIVWATSNLTDAAPGIGTIINSTLDDCDNCVNSIKASDYTSGGGIDTALANKLDSTGDASNTTSTFTKASGDTSTMTSGGKLSAIFTAISSFFASVASALGGKADKANITGATKCKITYNGQGIVTSGANLEASDIPNLSASKITSGTFGTDRIADDAITAAKVKDNETLPVNITGDARALPRFLTLNSGTDTAGSAIVWQEIGRIPFRGTSGAPTTIVLCGQGNIGTLPTNWILEFNYRGTTPSGLVYAFGNISTANEIKFGYYIEDNSDRTMHIIVKYPEWIRTVNILCLNKDAGFTFDVKSASTTEPTGIVYVTNKLASVTANYGSTIGSPTTPVYVDSNGQVRPCTASNTLKSNTATLYIAGTFGEGNIPYYHVKDIKNGCVNYVHVKDIPYNTCSITIEAPALASGEEYDYVVVFDTFTNSNLIGSIDVENCKTAGRMDNGVFVVDSMALTSANPQYVPMIIVTGNVASSKWYNRT